MAIETPYNLHCKIAPPCAFGQFSSVENKLLGRPAVQSAQWKGKMLTQQDWGPKGRESRFPVGKTTKQHTVFKLQEQFILKSFTGQA